MAQPHKKPTPQEVAWAWVRLVLGLAQIGGVIASLALLAQTGLSSLSISAVRATTLLTLTSRSLFAKQ